MNKYSQYTRIITILNNCHNAIIQDIRNLSKRKLNVLYHAAAAAATASTDAAIAIELYSFAAMARYEVATRYGSWDYGHALAHDKILYEIDNIYSLNDTYYYYINDLDLAQAAMNYGFYINPCRLYC